MDRLRQSRHKQEVGGDYWRLTAEASGGGLFVDLGSHQLDLLDYLLGPIEDVQASVSRSNVRAAHEVGDPVEDNVRMIFRQGASWPR
jgi:predicted dehydrogenase